MLKYLCNFFPMLMEVGTNEKNFPLVPDRDKAWGRPGITQYFVEALKSSSS